MIGSLEKNAGHLGIIMKGLESQESESSTDHGVLREGKCRGAPREGIPVACPKMGTDPG